MQNLEHDMDDLFQRAAENYPLKKGNGDWESISKGLAEGSKPAEEVPPQQKKNHKRLFGLALLLVIIAGSLIGYMIFSNELPWPYRTIKFTKQSDKGTGRTEEIINRGDASPKLTGAQKKKNSASKNSSLKFFTARNKSSYVERINQAPAAESGIEDPLVRDDSNKYLYQQIPAENNGRADRAIALKKLNEGLQKTLPANVKLTNREKLNNDIVNANKSSPAVRNKKGFYLGFIAGPDFSRVKKKSFSNSGYNAGLQLGYRISKKLSLESGIFWNKKYYDSEGKNFSMDKVGSTMPSGMVIDNLESQSTFVEIPLKIKYDFLSKKNSAVFVAGGVSSYVMTKERNMYTITYNGTQQKMEGIYDEKNYGVPAVTNLSFGYEHSVSKYFDIRIEPYLKIPLQGMGVGSLPVTSAGLQIGITGRLK